MVRHHRGGRVGHTPGSAADPPTADPPAGAGRWVQVTGTVVEARKLDGYPDPTMEFTVRLEPEGREPFPAEIRYDERNEYELYADLYPPDPGIVTGFLVDTGSGEVRFDMSDVRNSTSARILARVDPEGSGPLVGSAPVVAAARPRWYVPATCPTCGATVDRAIASTAAAPSCGVCSGPLPAQPYP